MHTMRLHERIEAQLRQSISDGRFATGHKLPTEGELSRQFKVSRSTVRLALKDLEQANLILRIRGRGTFVNDPSLRESGAGALTRIIPTSPASLTAHPPIGVVLRFSAESDALQTGILLGIEHAAKSRGYNILFARTDEGDETSEHNAINQLLKIGVCGMIVMPISNYKATAGIRMLVERNVPLVLVDRYLSDLDTSYVTSDNCAGAYRATEHLIILGYRRFAFAHHKGGAEVLITTSVQDRYAGFCRALQHYGLAGSIRPAISFDEDDPDALKRVLALRAPTDPLPPAVVAVSDHVALSILRAASAAGLKPPDDFALVGYDDLPMVSHMPVPLTTVAQPRYEQGFQAGHLLLDKVQGHPVRNDKLLLTTTLIVRESCGAHRIVKARVPA